MRARPVGLSLVLLPALSLLIGSCGIGQGASPEAFGPPQFRYTIERMSVIDPLPPPSATAEEGRVLIQGGFRTGCGTETVAISGPTIEGYQYADGSSRLDLSILVIHPSSRCMMTETRYRFTAEVGVPRDDSYRVRVFRRAVTLNRPEAGDSVLAEREPVLRLDTIVEVH